MLKLFYVLLFAAAAGVIFAVQIANRSEAEDSYEYAWQTELGERGMIYHPHHLLYGALSKDIYSALRLLGYRGRAHLPMRLTSALCAAGAVLLMYLLCRRNAGINPIGSLIAAATLLFSYGFWRYGNEVEVMPMASLLALGAFYAAGRPDADRRDALLAGILAGLSVTIHIFNIIPALIAVPAIFILRRRFRLLAAYAALAIALAGAIYIGVYAMESDSIMAASPHVADFGLLTIPKGIAALLHNVVSANFMLGFDSVRAALPQLFPARMMAEEIMLGAAMPAWTAYFGAVSATLLAASLLAGIVLAIRSSRGGQSTDDRSSGRVIALAALAWLGAYALLLFLTEAANPELWVMALVPLAVVYAVFVLGPLSSASRLWPAAALLLLLAAHNFAAGLLPLTDPAGDYNRAKSEWLLANARPTDMIVTAGNPVFERFLRYHSPAPVVYLHRLDEPQLAAGEQTLKALSAELPSGGRLLLTGDIFDQPPSLLVRFPRKTAAIESFAGELGKGALLLHADELWPVYAALPTER